MGNVLTRYYQSSDVVALSRDLLGKFLFTNIDGQLTGGMITETEAYAAPEDKASHAYGNRRTKRTEVIFHQGGRAYVYLCYGMHTLFNIVTNVEGIPHAILIRAIEPSEGLEVMLDRRGKETPREPLINSLGSDRASSSPTMPGACEAHTWASRAEQAHGVVGGEGVRDGSRRVNQRFPKLTNGPGMVSQALGITTKHNGLSLSGPTIWLEDRGISPKKISATPRVGIDYAEEWKEKPWRFQLI